MKFDEWKAAGYPSTAVVRVAGEADIGEDNARLMNLERIVIEFETFMDGRGFSHARRLRELGYTGELLAAGDVLPDQWQFMERCGFTALEDPELHATALSLTRFGEAYQRDVTQPLPLFQRRG